MNDTWLADDGVRRCHWSRLAPGFPDYHDREWGFPVGDDRLLFERLCLEGFQSGLSWRTILDKRENFRRAFCGFDFAKVAKFRERDVERLLQDAGIVRHRGKIEAVIHNARLACAMVGSGESLAALLWRFEPDERSGREPQAAGVCPEAAALSKELRRRGWKFVGPTTVHSMMQAAGIINDHVRGCATRSLVDAARRRFVRPRA